MIVQFLKSTFILVCSIVIPNSVLAELSEREVADKTIKIGGLEEKKFYYSFAKGDKVTFSFEEVKGKPIKELEIKKNRGNTIYAQFKVSEVSKKTFTVLESGVFEFRLANGSLSGRVCSIHIVRKPVSEVTQNFNTGWEWKTVFDTTYYLVNQDSITGFDTTYRSYLVKEVLSIDTNYYEYKKNEKIHTLLNSNGDRSLVSFDLPQLYQNQYEIRSLIGWAYWFGTEGIEGPEITNQLKAANLVSKVSPVTGLALGLWALSKSLGGENLDYGILDGYASAMLYLAKDGGLGFDWGDGCSSSKQFTDWYPSTFYLGFDNDHTYPVNVDIIVSVVLEVKKFHDVKHKEEIVTPRVTILKKKKMKISESRIRSILY